MRICAKNCLLRECVFYNENAFGGYCSSGNECEVTDINENIDYCGTSKER